MNFLIINLKKNTFTIAFIIFTISLLLFSETNLIAARNGFSLFINNVFPALFPFFIATEILYKTNFINICSKFLSKIARPIFNIPPKATIALILGAISGYPIGAKIVCNLKKDKIISNIEAERLIAYTNNSSPLFILATVGISLFHSKQIGYKLLFVHIISSILVGIIFRNWKKTEDKLFTRLTSKNQQQNNLISISNFGETLCDAIKNSISPLFTVCGFIILFSIIISTLETTNLLSILSFPFTIFNVPPDASKSFLNGLLELTNGVNQISIFYSDFPILTLMITSFLLGFSGLSILLQIYSIISKENISIKPYFYGKILQGLFSSILILFLI